MKIKLNNLKKNFLFFFKNADIRWKLRKLGKILPFNLYPRKFEFRGFKKIYTLILFNLIFLKKFQKKKINFPKY